MSERLLSKYYYVNENGRRDKFYEESYDCYVLCAYMIAKAYSYDPKDLLYCSVDDLTFYIDIGAEGKINNFFFSAIPNLPSYIQMNQIKEQDGQAIPVLQNMLDRGEAVLITTVYEFLEWSVHYNPEFNPDELKGKQGRHTFVILHYDKDYYYYVEDPFSQINYEYFDAVNRRKDIGRYPRDKMERIFCINLQCFQVKFNWDQKELPYTRMKEAIRKTLKNYDREVLERNNGDKRYIGRNAIIKLIDIAKDDGIHYDSMLKDLNISFRNAVDWNCSILLKKRKTLGIAIKNLIEDKRIANVDEDFLEAVQDAQNKWMICRNAIIKDTANGKREFDKYNIKFIKKALEADDRMVEKLKKYSFDL